MLDYIINDIYIYINTCICNILYTKQFCFRTNYSTEVAVLQFVDDLTHAISNGN